MDAAHVPPHHDAILKALRARKDSPLGAPDARLALYEGQVLLDYTEGGRRHSKLISYAACRAAFSGEPVDSGWLPPGTVRYGEGSAGAYLVRYLPPAVHRLPFLLEADAPPEILAVPLPGLVFAGRGSQYWLWALPGPAFSPDAPAYYPPLPNIYDQGAICFGPDNRPPQLGAGTFAAAWDIFCAAPFNNHLAGSRSRAFPNDVRGQLATLAAAGATRYPDDDLLPYARGTGGSIGDVVARACTPEGRL